MKYNKPLAIILLLMIFTISISYSGNAQKRVLQIGMRGTDVQELQENLAMLGEKLNIDGVFGPGTKKIVVKFQKKAGLTPDGVVGDETRSKIKEALTYDKHTVKPGDTLSELAAQHDITVDVIKEANNLRSHKIKVGQELIIPRTALGGGITANVYDIVPYKVRRGDSLLTISQKFNTTVRTLKRLNNLETDHLKYGETIKVSKLVLDLSNASRNTTRVKRNFIWPVRGRITSDYGWRVHPILQKKSFHKGIDIAIITGTPIKSIKSGKVISSGWNGGLGKTVSIDHGNGVVSLYGHNSRLLVKKGQYVKRGQVIAKSGNTGRSTGPHLEFRMMINGKPVNPHKYIN